MEFFRYQGAEVGSQLENMPAEERNNLPYGIIKLNESGTILEFNLTESSITGRNQNEVLGKNFFSDVAPCTNTPEFFGKFQEAFEKQFLNTVFDYLFDYQMEPVRVKIHMIYAKVSGSGYVWVIVKRVLT